MREDPAPQPGRESKRERERKAEREAEPGLRPETAPADTVTGITEQLVSVKLDETRPVEEIQAPSTNQPSSPGGQAPSSADGTAGHQPPEKPGEPPEDGREASSEQDGQTKDEQKTGSYYDGLEVLSWDDVCPDGSRIEKIAEASYAEVYRITNERGTSIIKVVRLQSPIKPQTKAQVRSGLVDEEPHPEEDMLGELLISEWLADIPGFVVYKERYVVKGKAPKALLETHQAFHRREKRKDPDRLQFYPSPSRYLDETRFLVVELGDAGTALEDFELTSISQVWDIFLHTALALARAEDLIQFEVSLDSPYFPPPAGRDPERPCLTAPPPNSTATSTRATSASARSARQPPSRTPPARSNSVSLASRSPSSTTASRERPRQPQNPPTERQHQQQHRHPRESSPTTSRRTSPSSRRPTRRSVASTGRCAPTCSAATACTCRRGTTGRPTHPRPS